MRVNIHNKATNLLFVVALFLMSLAVSCTNNNQNEVRIGEQIWMSENLSLKVFQNGDSIKQAKSFEEWIEAANAGIPAWCYYLDDSSSGQGYEVLYNGFAISDARGLAPKGWHIPNDKEWDKLIESLEGDSIAGTKLKSKDGWDTNGSWVTPDEMPVSGSDKYGFRALPVGYRKADKSIVVPSRSDQSFVSRGRRAMWWSSTSIKKGQSEYGRFYYITSTHQDLFSGDGFKGMGCSVRCIKDVDDESNVDRFSQTNELSKKDLSKWNGTYKYPTGETLTLEIKEGAIIGVLSNGNDADIELSGDGNVLIDGSIAYLSNDTIYYTLEATGSSEEFFLVKEKSRVKSNEQLRVSAFLIYNDGTLSEFDILREPEGSLWNVYMSEEDRKPSEKTRIFISGNLSNVFLEIKIDDIVKFSKNGIRLNEEFEVDIEGTGCGVLSIQVKENGNQIYGDEIVFGCGE